MTLAIGVTVAAEDIRHFRPTAGHRWPSENFWCGRLRLSRNWTRQQIQWTGGGADFGGGDAQVPCCRCQATMAEQQLNGADIGTGFKQMDGERMSQRMRRDRLSKAGKL